MAAPGLTNDCFAHDNTVLPVDTALKRVCANLTVVVEAETVALHQALGRALGEDVVSGVNVPPHDNAAVDGWAVKHADLNTSHETRLPVGARIPAGHPLNHPLTPGTAARVFTGAPLPAGTDTIVMQEDCRREGEAVVVPPGVVLGANRRLTGEDIAAGARVLTAGRRLSPPDIGIAASIGRTGLPVQASLRVAVFSTGDELREPGVKLHETTLPAGAIYDSNRHSLMALLTRFGCVVSDLGILPDNRDAIRQSLAAATEDHHVIITSGGVSAGEEDHVRAAVGELGRLNAWRLAIKPGRPVALGVVRGRAFIGLPGNPVAMAITFLHIAQPILSALAGYTWNAPMRFPVSVDFSHAKKTGRREYLRVRLEHVAEGLPVATLAGRQGSGILSSLAAADGLLELGEDNTGFQPGDRAAYLPLSEVMS
jgi:molybdopterin molybdotransferase